VAERQELLPLGTRLALRPAEAAHALGISERKLREILPELPHVRLGNAVVIPVKPLEEWLAVQAKANMENADRVAGEILEEMVGNQ
jgi:hypothetical protein